MSRESTTGSLGYGAQGAYLGYSAGGPWGAVVGGVLGGIGGAIGGHQEARARKMAKKAVRIQRQLSYMQAAVARRDLIRNARMERASSVAALAAQEGGLQSSPGAGAVSSYQSQFGFNLGYFDRRIQDYLAMQRFMDKSGKYARRAGDTYAIMDTIIAMGNSMGSMSGSTSSQIPSGGMSSMGGASGATNATGRLPVGGTGVA